MDLWRFLLVFALVFGSVLPHCAAATPRASSAPHHAGMAHDGEQCMCRTLFAKLALGQ